MVFAPHKLEGPIEVQPRAGRVAGAVAVAVTHTNRHMPSFSDEHSIRAVHTRRPSCGATLSVGELRLWHTHTRTHTLSLSLSLSRSHSIFTIHTRWFYLEKCQSGTSCGCTHTHTYTHICFVSHTRHSRQVSSGCLHSGTRCSCTHTHTHTLSLAHDFRSLPVRGDY